MLDLSIVSSCDPLLGSFLDPSSRLRAFEVLELDGRPFAWHFSFLVNGKFLLYQHTFDLDSWDYAPGEVLLSHLLQFAQEHVTREFDFGSGDEAYKPRVCKAHSGNVLTLYRTIGSQGQASGAGSVRGRVISILL